jgi:hypothetical protein
MTHADREQVVPIFRRFGGNAAGNCAAGTGSVFDNELLSKGFGQPVGKDAGRDISSAASPKPDQNMDRP